MIDVNRSTVFTMLDHLYQLTRCLVFPGNVVMYHNIVVEVDLLRRVGFIALVETRCRIELLSDEESVRTNMCLFAVSSN